MKPTPDEIEEAKDEGWIARTEGKRMQLCPYTYDNSQDRALYDLRHAWYAGWHAANRFLETPVKVNWPPDLTSLPPGAKP